MKECHSCDTLNDDSSKFCSSCGKKLSSKTICPYCKKDVKPTDTFCNHCGKSLKKSTKTKKSKMNKKLKISLIALGAFFGFIIIAYLSLFLLIKFYLAEKYYLRDTGKGTVELVEKQYIPESTKLTEPTFGKLVVCESIDDETYEPINSTNEFDIGFREIYAAINVSDAIPDDTFTYKWKYADSGETISDFTFNYFKPDGYIPDYILLSEEDDINNYHLFSEPGDYVVEFYHNEKLIDTAMFTVNQTGLTFGDLVVCSEIDDSTDAPLGEIGEFDIGIRNICATIHITGVKAEDSWSFVFREAGTSDTIREFTDSYTPNQEDYFEGYKAICLNVLEDESIRNIRMFGQPSHYTVDFYHNGDLIDSTDFIIKPTEVSFGYFGFYEGIEETEDGTFIPVGEKSEFEYGTEVIVAAVKTFGWISKDDYYYFIWKNKDTGKIIQVISKETGEPADYDIYALDEGYYELTYCYNGQYTPEGKSFKDTIIFGNPGIYIVEFYYNGEFTLDNEFTILKP